MDKLTHAISTKRAIVCVGSGGVGKTTISAAIGILGAQKGRRVITLTIDPARRLAQALGIEGFHSEVQRVALPTSVQKEGMTIGSLSIAMLDAGQTFRELVARYAPNESVRQRLLDNPLFQYLTKQLVGIQEYMALERLLSYLESEEYDLVVLDTPPSTHALDFLRAPELLLSALDHSALKWFIDSVSSERKFSLNFVARSMKYFLEQLGKITGAEFLQELALFLSDLQQLVATLRVRIEDIAKQLREPSINYLIVSSKERESLIVAEELGNSLQKDGMAVLGVLLNRENPDVGLNDLASVVISHTGKTQAEIASQEVKLQADVSLCRKLLFSAHQRASSEQQNEARWLAHLPQFPIVGRLPVRSHDIHSSEELLGLSAWLDG